MSDWPIQNLVKWLWPVLGLKIITIIIIIIIIIITIRIRIIIIIICENGLRYLVRSNEKYKKLSRILSDVALR